MAYDLDLFTFCLSSVSLFRCLFKSVTIFNRVIHNHILSSIINSVLKSVSEDLTLLSGCQTNAAAEIV